MNRASLRRVMVMTRHSEIAEAQARAALARQELNGSVNALVSRIKPSGLAHQAFSGARKAGWVSLAFRVYRFRATALTVLGLIANLKARKKRRSEEHTYELQSIMRRSYAVFCLQKTHNHYQNKTNLN